MHVRIGTRGSRLARWQAEWVAEELRRRKVEVELVPLATEGDRKDQGALAQLGAIGIFTREIQRAVLENRVDLAVHSLKDLPTAPTPGIHLAAVPLRGPCEDVLVTREKRVLVDCQGKAGSVQAAYDAARKFSTSATICKLSRSVAMWKHVYKN